METIIFLGTHKSGSSRDAIQAAEKMGYFTVLLTSSKKLLSQREEFADVHQMQRLDLNNPSQIREYLNFLQEKQGKKICAIISLVDPFVTLAAELNSEFCSSTLSVKAMELMENKLATLEALWNTTYIPAYTVLTQADDLSEFVRSYHTKLPLVIKAPQSTGSKDVFIATSRRQLYYFSSKLLQKYPDSPIIVEEYLNGPQYLIETVVTNGKVHLVAIIEQEVTLVNYHALITGYSVLTEPPQQLSESLTSAVQTILKSLGMTHGSCHLEMRRIGNSWKLIEINPRTSGGAMTHRVVPTR